MLTKNDKDRDKVWSSMSELKTFTIPMTISKIAAYQNSVTAY